jgi:phosphatidylserine/phosphatidylglycerophosphate/cardiolipin synthase-like enzyme
VAAFLQGLRDQGLSSKGLAAVCRLVVAERLAVQARAPDPELVWTGPETPGAAARDTAIVVRQMLKSAQQSVLLSSYNIYDARTIFEPLAERMAEVPALRVRLYVNLTSDRALKQSEEAYGQAFVHRFLQYNWPGGRRPEAYYDRRLFQKPQGRLHAKCVVVDAVDVLVSSANLSAPAYGEGQDAAHTENIEAGIRVQNRTLARHLIHQFESLVHTGTLAPIAGLQG